ncbi:MAG: ATP-binding protein [Kofleriaceae bacterium]
MRSTRDLQTSGAGKRHPRRFAEGTQPISRVERETGRYSARLEPLPDPALAVTARGIVVAMNGAAETLLGADREEVFGRAIDTVLTGPGLHLHGHANRHSFEFVTESQHAMLLHRSGRRIPVECLVSPDPTNDVLVIMVRRTASDPSSLQSDEVAAICHDLVAPLSVISLDLEALGDGQKPVDTDVLRALGRIGANIDYLQRLVCDLRDTTAIMNGRFEVARELIDIADVVREVVRRVAARDRDRIRIASAESAIARGDRARLERVVANLLHNALKYSPRDRTIEIIVETSATNVRGTVRDHGPGLPLADAARLFERFRRSRDQRGRDGVGLGLYVCRTIVEAHGGTIGYEPAPGGGSCFYFELPRVRMRSRTIKDPHDGGRGA